MAKVLMSVMLALLSMSCFAQPSEANLPPGLRQALDDTKAGLGRVMDGVLVATAPTPNPVSTGSVTVERKQLGTFPTSSVTPKGKTWDVMHEDGFTGDFDVACKLIKLDEYLCNEWKRAHADGRGVAMDMPKSGITLDALTYTRKGVHYVQENVKVDLVKFPTLAAMVYELTAKDGTKVHVIRHLGCSNISKVVGWQSPLVVAVKEPQQKLPLAPATEMCARKYLQVNIWDPKALELPGVRETISETRRAQKENVFAPNRLSRKFGRMFREMHDASTLARGVQSHNVQVILRKATDGKDYQVFSGQVKGMYRMSFPDEFSQEGDTMRIVFSDYGVLASPTPTGIHVMQSEVKIRCGETFHVHGVDNPA
jgi:hypothetical protein